MSSDEVCTDHLVAQKCQEVVKMITRAILVLRRTVCSPLALPICTRQLLSMEVHASRTRPLCNMLLRSKLVSLAQDEAQPHTGATEIPAMQDILVSMG